MKINNYNFFDHLHNYGMWTAARAVQRGFTTTKNIAVVVEKSGLRGLLDNKDNWTSATFDEFQRKTAHAIIDGFESLGIRCSYGQASKIIAIYIKTTFVIREKEPLKRIAHPPVDGILLAGLHKDFPHLKLGIIKWTRMGEREYWETINKLRTLEADEFWKIEHYWHPSREPSQVGL